MVTKLERKTKETAKKAKAPKAEAEATPAAPNEATPNETTAREDTPNPTSNITIEQMADSYLRHLESKGRTRKTVMSYGIDLKLAQKVLGADTKVASLTADKVQEYFDSPRVTTRRDGQPKATAGLDKTRRVLRLALEWLHDVGVLEKAPIPEKPKKAEKAEPKK